MTFSDKLIALRKKAGWSQEELAERLNVKMCIRDSSSTKKPGANNAAPG